MVKVVPNGLQDPLTEQSKVLYLPFTGIVSEPRPYRGLRLGHFNQAKIFR